MRISDWSSDVCSSDLSTQVPARVSYATSGRTRTAKAGGRSVTLKHSRAPVLDAPESVNAIVQALAHLGKGNIDADVIGRSEEHTSELQSLMRISYAVFCLKKKKTTKTTKQRESMCQAE